MASTSDQYDFAIVGAGVIGLSLAWQLANHGSVVVIDRQKIGREASWAGAGILPPASQKTAVHPLEQLTATSFALHAAWAEQLRSATGIDTGYRECGAVLIARTVGEAAALEGQRLQWLENDVVAETISVNRVVELVPSLAHCRDSIQTAVLLPDEAQIRNPDHLAALVAACQKQNVKLIEEAGEVTFPSLEQTVTIQAGQQKIQARRMCLTAGCWTGQLAESIGLKISMLPVRGQMLLYKLPSASFAPVVYEGTRYIVPRDDGHVVVGSTLEEVGFDKSTTEAGISGLKAFANGLIPELTSQRLVKQWSGLRPATFDGFPYISKVPKLTNVWVNTGHFRSGLLLSTGSAMIMAELMTDRVPSIDIMPFRVDRG